MAIRSLFAIALLSSAHADTTVTQVRAALEKGVAPLHSLSQDIYQFHDLSSVSLLQENNTNTTDVNATMSCMTAMMAPCVNFTSLTTFFNADSAMAAAMQARDFCTACDGNATAQYEQVLANCSTVFNASMTTMYMTMQTATEVVCANPNCTGAFGWAFQEPEMRRGDLCMNLDTCGSSFVSAYLNISAEGMLNVSSTDYTCIQPNLALMCARDNDNSSLYCTDFFMDMNESSSQIPSEVVAYCGSSCEQEFPMLIQATIDGQCMEPDNTSESDCNYVTLENICTANADNELCVTLDMDDEDFFNISLCPSSVFEGGEAPANCSAECAGQLQAFEDLVGCCASFALDASCATAIPRAFINETCGVSLEMCGEEVPATNATMGNMTTTTAPNSTVDPSSYGERVSVTGSSVALYAVLAVVAFVVLL